MTVQTFRPDGSLRSESKNLRGILDNASRRGVSGISVEPITGDTSWDVVVCVEYYDNFYSVTKFASAKLCSEFLEKRWPGKVRYLR